MAKQFDADLSLEAIDRATIMHGSTDLKAHASGAMGSPRIITGGNGIRVTDSKGRESIDSFAALYCVNVGYGRQEIADAIYEQAQKLAYFHSFVGHSNEPVINLSRRILERAPAGMSRIYYGMSGSDANETNIKIAWYYNNVLGRPEKRKIISRRRAYHGSGIFTGSMTGLPIFQQHFNLPLDDIVHTVTPHYYREAQAGMTEESFATWCAEQLEALIQAQGPDTIAAFIAEPIMGTGGIIPPPATYWEKIQPILRKYDILLICDEVVTGFGRLGRWFGSEYYGISPDIMTIAKGLTSAYLPLSGSIVSDGVWEVLEQGAEQFGPFGHAWTYSAHPLSAAAAVANLDIIEKENLVEHAGRTGDYLQERLREEFSDHPLVGEVRGAGLLGALELVSDKTTRARFPEEMKVGPRVSAACLEEGLICRAMAHGDIIGFAPPLIVTNDDIDEIIALTRRGLDAVDRELASSERRTA